ncbi:GNAT family N-acetyltransferase, partial [Vibrio cholerae]|nr:GNAT family N-acetyltransferase [Vibrio cholerae]MVF60962.1 GNAT family N-acetyltransferase [Vibrio cholerae]
SVVVFEFSGMRCQPLRRALCRCRKKTTTTELN